MISAQQTFPGSGGKAGPDLETWLSGVAAAYAPADAALLLRACDLAVTAYAGRTLPSGEAVLQHVLGTAAILAQMRMDPETLAAAILQAVPDYLENASDKLRTEFGSAIAQLVEGVARMGQIQEYGETAGAAGKNAQAQAEGLRQMLLAMVQDIRVVLIKLAERTQTMRSLAHADEALRRKTAIVTRDIFAPLANRLGVWQVKWELEDLVCRYLEPDTYKKIAQLLDERRVDRERYITQVIDQLKHELQQAGIKGEVSGRPKHIYSIVNKMKQKHLDFSEVYDVRALRVLVPDVKDCYTVLGIVHYLWQPISGEFDDYISHPKSNDYRSLHTAVIGPEGKALEVQMRTFDMHQHAEYGVAAHWRYKEGGKASSVQDDKIAWLRQILEWKEDLADSSELLEQFKSELKEDRIFVFTPQGRVIDLPAGATPVDFAYHVHSTLGDRCRGAKVGGSIVPLNYKLANCQRVEILTAKQGGPSRDWLNPTLGYVMSPRSKAKIRHWFKYQHFEENVSQGRAQLDRELHRLGLSGFNQEKLAQKFSHSKVEDFLAAMGRGDITTHQVVTVIQEELAPKVEAEKPQFQRPPKATGQSGTVLIEGVGNLLTAMAKCCKPAPPDLILGYVTRGRGVTIHRRDCPSVMRLIGTRPDQVVGAAWSGAQKALFETDLEVDANDRQGLLRDISEVFAREKVNVIRVNSQSKDGMARMGFTVEIAGLEQLSRVLALVNHVDGVVEAKRLV
jgi:GTP pyrophosphokinase